MVNTKFGTVNWDDIDESISFKKARPAKDVFLKLDQGSNVVRIVTKPHQYSLHKWKSGPDVAGFGSRVMCSMLNGKCPLCEQAKEKTDKPKSRWLVGVIDRKTQSYKVLDISVAVLNAIKQLNQDSDWGNPEQYDLDIKMNRAGGATGYYSVLPKVPKPMSEADLAIKKMVAEQYAAELLDRCTPPTYEAVLSRMESIRKWDASKRATQTPVAEESSDEGESEETPDFQF